MRRTTRSDGQEQPESSSRWRLNWSFVGAVVAVVTLAISVGATAYAVSTTQSGLSKVSTNLDQVAMSVTRASDNLKQVSLSVLQLGLTTERLSDHMDAMAEVVGDLQVFASELDRTVTTTRAVASLSGPAAESYLESALKLHAFPLGLVIRDVQEAWVLTPEGKALLVAANIWDMVEAKAHLDDYPRSANEVILAVGVDFFYEKSEEQGIDFAALIGAASVLAQNFLDERKDTKTASLRLGRD